MQIGIGYGVKWRGNFIQLPIIMVKYTKMPDGIAHSNLHLHQHAAIPETAFPEGTRRLVAPTLRTGRPQGSLPGGGPAPPVTRCRVFSGP